MNCALSLGANCKTCDLPDKCPIRKELQKVKEELSRLKKENDEKED